MAEYRPHAGNCCSRIQGFPETTKFFECSSLLGQLYYMREDGWYASVSFYRALFIELEILFSKSLEQGWSEFQIQSFLWDKLSFHSKVDVLYTSHYVLVSNPLLSQVFKSDTLEKLKRFISSLASSSEWGCLLLGLHKISGDSASFYAQLLRK